MKKPMKVVVEEQMVRVGQVLRKYDRPNTYLIFVLIICGIPLLALFIFGSHR